GGSIQLIAMALGMFYVLDAATVPQQFSQRRLALNVWLTPYVLAVDHDKVESASAGSLVIYSAVQGVEVRHPIKVQPNDLSIKNCCAFDPRCCFCNQRVTLRPVGPIDRE